MKKRIYIAGAITGLDEATYTENFARAERYLESFGYEPLNPCKLVDQTEGRDYNDYMHDALRHCLDADGLYMLSNWHTSKGAKAEHAIAVIYEKTIWYEGTKIQGMPEDGYSGMPRKVKAEFVPPGHLRLCGGYRFYPQDIGQPVELPDGGSGVIMHLFDQKTAKIAISSGSYPYFNESWIEIKRVFPVEP